MSAFQDVPSNQLFVLPLFEPLSVLKIILSDCQVNFLTFVELSGISKFCMAFLAGTIVESTISMLELGGLGAYMKLHGTFMHITLCMLSVI